MKTNKLQMNNSKIKKKRKYMNKRAGVLPNNAYGDLSPYNM